MNTRDYLARITYTGKTSPALNVLAALQKAHLLTVPFENLDIHAGTTITLELPRLYRKIVTMRRGGFCYELNGLFHWLLVELGFDSKLLMGRVHSQTTKGYGPEFDHMLNLVEVDGRRWIVDVGFGDFSLAPLELVLDQPIADANGMFLIERESEEYYRVSRFSREQDQYSPQYIFSSKERRLEDFSAMCHYHQTSPRSHFTRNTVCSIATPGGRITLTDDTLIITDRGTRTESPISNEQQFDQALLRYFNIQLNRTDDIRRNA